MAVGGGWDIHCHLLPGVDDGPEEEGEALAMARLLVQEGYEGAVATPHGAAVERLGGVPALLARLEAWQARLAAEGIPLRVVPGTEHLLTPDLGVRWEEGRSLTLNGSRFILVEVDFQVLPPYLDSALFELQVRGLVPILAHPERQAVLQDRPDLLVRLHRRGVVLQITASSLTGVFGPKARRAAFAMLREGLVSLIATDAHRDRGGRAPTVAAAREAVREVLGERGEEVLFRHNPRAVVENGGLEPPPRPRPRPRWHPVLRLPLGRRRRPEGT